MIEVLVSVAGVVFAAMLSLIGFFLVRVLREIEHRLDKIEQRLEGAVAQLDARGEARDAKVRDLEEQSREHGRRLKIIEAA